MTGKAVKIVGKAYNALPKARQMAVEKAKREGNPELAQAIDAMGIGAFASYLISTELERLRAQTLGVKVDV